jgi:hypothetical protein
MLCNRVHYRALQGNVDDAHDPREVACAAAIDWSVTHSIALKLGSKLAMMQIMDHAVPVGWSPHSGLSGVV